MTIPDTVNDGPPFSAPWQAQVFALAVHLSQQGVFSWSQWAEVFARHRRQSATAGTADAPEQYYRDWLCALEELLVARGTATTDALGALKQAWTEAYLDTPHGDPVHLR